MEANSTPGSSPSTPAGSPSQGQETPTESSSPAQTPVKVPANVTPTLSPVSVPASLKEKTLTILYNLSYPDTPEKVSSLFKNSPDPTRSDLIDAISIGRITPKHAFRYVLDAYLETRLLHISSDPFTSDEEYDRIKKASENLIIDRWSIPVPQPEPIFTDYVARTLPIPEFTHTVPCNLCSNGSVLCKNCDGLEFEKCAYCKGTHKILLQPRTLEDDSFKTCFYCLRTDRVPCSGCIGAGTLPCPNCKGYQFLRQTYTMEVRWSREMQMYDTPRGEVTQSHLKYKNWLERDLILNGMQTSPVVGVDPELDAVSEKFMKAWMSRYQSPSPVTKLITCFQRVGVIPLVKVDYSWKEEEEKENKGDEDEVKVMDGSKPGEEEEIMEDSKTYFYLIGTQFDPIFPNNKPPALEGPTLCSIV